ncbi:hypothetical protein PENFLA_c040G05940 [Penicillium flavigenum]|uniref:Uncharacterized protein n=1 Tax=Penicillium flavigenum TaxID=254877 RepID=A0A1V6SJH3_9EURO|nr:hypothetical protein PENFLA_c040G05940 [Penicillium flavigenum]
MGAVITRYHLPSPLSPADGAPTDEDWLSFKDVFVSTSGYSRDWWRTSGPTSSAVAPPSDSVHYNAALEPWQPAKGQGCTHQVMDSVNMPVRKRTAAWSGRAGGKPACKKRITEEMVEGNVSLFLPISDKYAIDTAAKVPQVSLPARVHPAIYIGGRRLLRWGMVTAPATSPSTHTSHNEEIVDNIWRWGQLKCGLTTLARLRYPSHKESHEQYEHF